MNSSPDPVLLLPTPLWMFVCLSYSLSGPHSMIDQVQAYPPKEVFFRVATEMFSDGTFNWGRVVALFYFACRLVLKVSGELPTPEHLELPKDQMIEPPNIVFSN